MVNVGCLPPSGALILFDTSEMVEVDHLEVVDGQSQLLPSEEMIDKNAIASIMKLFYEQMEILKTTLKMPKSSKVEGSLFDFLMKIVNGMLLEKSKVTKHQQRDIMTTYFTLFDIIKDQEKKILDLTHRLEKAEFGTGVDVGSVPPVPHAGGHAFIASETSSKERVRTYASAVKTPAFGKLPTFNAILVESTNKEETVEDLKRRLIVECEPRENKLQVIGTRVTKNKKLLVQCNSQLDIKKLESIIETKPGLQNVKAIAMKKLKPKIIIYGTPKDLEDEQFLDDLQEQNHIELDKDSAKVCFSFNTRNGKNWVLEVDKIVYHALKAKNKIYIGFSSCKVDDYIKPLRCNKCCRLGHLKKFCTQADVGCSGCSGPHLLAECPDRSSKKCINCLEYNQKFKKNVDIKHSAFDVTYPCYIFHRSRLISRTDYV